MDLDAASAPLESYYHELIGSLDAIVWEADAETFQFTFVSAQAERILGYPPEAWTETDFWLKILHPEDRDEALETCLRGLREGRDTQFEYRVATADGAVRWICDIVRLLRDQQGVVRQLRGIMVDVTER
ncbi:MAG: PAS domain-containing protein, partial [Gemmatimonadetes bacterium]|nr:PAS domain-containing protein [Gemmatimonadota bacterium]